MMRYWPYVAAAVLSGVVLLPASATALNVESATRLEQSVTVTPTPIFEITKENGRVGVMNRDQCQAAFEGQQPITFRFNFNVAVVPGGGAELEGPYLLSVAEEERESQCDENSTSGCEDLEDAEGVVIDDVDTNPQKEIRVDFDDLVRSTVGASDDVTQINVARDCLPSGGAGFHNQYFIRYIIEDNTSTDRVTRVSDAVVEVDALAAPQPDSFTGLSATDERVYMEWTQTQSSEVESYVAFVSTTDVTGRTLAQLQNDDDVTRQTISLDNPDPDDGEYSGSVKVGSFNLSAGDRVWVGISTEDEVENLSQPIFFENSAQVVEVLDFWEKYRNAGGSQPGCSITGAGPPGAFFILCALAGFVFVRRRL